jgi:hypothetical protein
LKLLKHLPKQIRTLIQIIDPPHVHGQHLKVSLALITLLLAVVVVEHQAVVVAVVLSHRGQRPLVLTQGLRELRYAIL